MKKDIVSMNFEELSSEFKEMGLPGFRATQVYDWLHKKCVASFDEMTNISSKLISKLKEEFTIDRLKVVTKETSKDGTCKYLYELSDGRLIETVLMKIIRGSNLEGYAGIKEINNVKDYQIIRPLLPYTKEDILEMLEITQVKNISILNFLPQGRGRQNKNQLQLSKEEFQLYRRGDK